MNIKFEADWNLIRERKQKMIRKNNEAENAKRIEHIYKIGDKILYRLDEKAKYGSNPYEGPYKIREIYDNGTVAIQKGSLIETINIRLIKPYKE